MTKQERVTGAVMIALAFTGVWFAMQVQEGGLAAPALGAILGAVILLAIGSSVLAGLAAALGGRTDERDRRVAVNAQAVRGYFYLVAVFGVLAYALWSGLNELANALFLTMIGIELVAGAVMLMLYRRAG